MPDLTRHAEAIWRGDLRKGSGNISSSSGVLQSVPYSVPSRFETGKGTNPEELLAAAHAGCFSMMLSLVLGGQQITPDVISTRATVTMGQRDGGWKILKVHLETEVSAAGLTTEALNRAATQAKEQCPVSILLKPGLEAISLEARLKNS